MPVQAVGAFVAGCEMCSVGSIAEVRWKLVTALAQRVEAEEKVEALQRQLSRERPGPAASCHPPELPGCLRASRAKARQLWRAAEAPLS